MTSWADPLVEPAADGLDGHQPHAVLGGRGVQQGLVEHDVDELAEHHHRQPAGIDVPADRRGDRRRRPGAGGRRSAPG
jgi:hypothetical protein